MKLYQCVTANRLREIWRAADDIDRPAAYSAYRSHREDCSNCIMEMNILAQLPHSDHSPEDCLTAIAIPQPVKEDAHAEPL